MAFKASRYNHFVGNGDSNVLAYNAFKNTLAMVTGTQYEIVQRLLADPDDYDPENQDELKLRHDLVAGHFLIPEALDEVEVLRMNHRIARFGGNSLGLTIAPTLACNFRCTYCFEQSCPDTMTRETEDALVEFVARRKKRLQSLHVVWFGGEPTLKIDTIERLTGALSKLCQENDIAFPPASIITNGYRLDRETAQRLAGLRITSAQVTLDGPAEIHDQRRMLHNGKGTFDKIIENIKASMDLLRITIRVNVSRENADRIGDFYTALEEHGLLNKVPFYFGQVTSNTQACADVASSCFSTQEHAAVVVELQKEALRRGVSSVVDYPSARHFGFCTAGNISGFVVAPSGMLFKCWSDLGPGMENSVGSLQEDAPTVPQLNTMSKYVNWDPLASEDCAACSHLPICAGGCPHDALLREEPSCSRFKYNLAEMLRLKCVELESRSRCAGCSS